MLLAIVGFPVVTSQLAFDDNLLALLSQRSETLAGLTPHGHVCESSDLLTFAIAVVKEFIVRNSRGCDRRAGVWFSSSWGRTPVTPRDHQLDFSSSFWLAFVGLVNGPPRFPLACRLCS